jgi:hypothetical protein
MNYKRLRGALNQADCEKLEFAWLEARRQGYPLDTRIDIKPSKNIDAATGYEWALEDWNWLGGWCRRNVGVFYAVCTREAAPNKKVHGSGEHFHYIAHIGSEDLRAKLLTAWRKRRSGPREVSLRKADYEDRFGPSGERGNALLYITKHRQNWQQDLPRVERVTREPAGLVLGRRYKITSNLRAAVDKVKGSIQPPIKTRN